MPLTHQLRRKLSISVALIAAFLMILLAPGLEEANHQLIHLLSRSFCGEQPSHIRANNSNSGSFEADHSYRCSVLSALNSSSRPLAGVKSAALIGPQVLKVLADALYPVSIVKIAHSNANSARGPPSFSTL